MRKRTKALGCVIRVAWRIYQANRKRNVAAVIAISTVIASVMTVFTVMDFLTAVQKRQNLQMFGTVAEGEYLGVTVEQYEKLSLSAAFADTSYRVYLGNVPGEGGVRTEMYYAPEKAADWCFHGLLDGRWPAKADELVVDEIYASAQTVATGDIVELDAMVNGSPVRAEFKVTGICGSNRIQGASELYVSEIFWRELADTDTMTVYCRFPYTEAAENLLLHTWEAAIPDTAATCHVNGAYAAGNGKAPGLMSYFWLLAAFLAAYLTIYTLYALSVMQDVRLFGGIKLQGVTAKQCSLIMRLQAVCQYMTALPLGVIAGLGIRNVIAPLFINRRFGEVEAVCVWRWENILYAALAAAFAVFMGIRKPMKFLRKLPPVHAAVFSGIGKLGKKERKSVKLSTRQMAWLNIGRNRRRSFLVAMSVCAAVFLFTCVVNLVETETASYIAYRRQPADFLIGTREFCNYYLDALSEDRIGHSPFTQGGDAWELDAELVDKLGMQLQQADRNVEILPFYYTFGINLNEGVTGRLEALLRDGKISERSAGLGKRYYEEQFADQSATDHTLFWTEMRYYVDFEALEQCRVLEGTLEREKFESGDYVVMISNLTFADNGTLYHAGEKVDLDSFPDGVHYVRQEDGYLEIQGGITREYEVLAVVDDVPPMCAYLGAPLVTFLPACNIPEEDGLYRLCSIAINTEDAEEAEPVVKQLVNAADADAYYLSYAVIRQEAAYEVRMLWLFGGGLAIVMAAMAGINFLNYVILGVAERREELAVLEAIGMTKKQLIAMIRWENLLVVAGAALCGFSIGMVGCAVMFHNWAAGSRLVNPSAFQVCSLNPVPGLIFIVLLAALACVYPNHKTGIGSCEHD